jgi:hypothetical protein
MKVSSRTGGGGVGGRSIKLLSILWNLGRFWHMSAESLNNLGDSISKSKIFENISKDFSFSFRKKILFKKSIF